MPDDVREFYELCGGIQLFKDKEYSLDIVSPDKVVPSNIVIVGERCEDDITVDWFIIADDSNGTYLSIDLDAERLGRCYDSFHETHGLSVTARL